ncbi:MAG: hypothetical protein Q9179_000074 [Wetmoreana sp. 5 TL-2023]
MPPGAPVGDPSTAGPPPVDPRTSEDCLFLDVLLPKKVWESRSRSRAAVLVWIHGGGFNAGWKDFTGRGYGLVSRSQQRGSQGVILVSINFRLGLFGWMNGAGVTANTGLLDQQFALQWIQKHIHRFGGDPSRVTLLGGSSGASAVEAHITAYGDTKAEPPFQNAIAQAPYLPYPLPDSQVDAVVRSAGVASLDELRSLVPDGNYVPDVPGKLLQQGHFDSSICVMTGFNHDEGSMLAPSRSITDEPSYTAYLEALIPALADDAAAVQHISQVLYPPVFDGSQGYTTQAERVNMTIADATVVCNVGAMVSANYNCLWTYAYEFSIPPAVHGTDLFHTFYDFEPGPGINTTVAETLQEYLVRFAEKAQPNSSKSQPLFKSEPPGLAMQNLGRGSGGTVFDQGGIKQRTQRCQFWQDAPYLGRFH